MLSSTPVSLFQDAQTEVFKVVVGGMDNNVYFVQCRESGEAVMVDAANDGATLVDLCHRLRVKTVVETHGHADHIQAVPAVRQAGYEVGIGAGDVYMLADHDYVIDDEMVIEAGRLRIRSIHTPGHTPGSTCFHVEGSPVLLSGDTLFPGGPGATRFSHSSFDDIIKSIRDRLFGSFPDETVVMPGHGASTTIGAERPHLDEWVARGW